MLLRCPAAFGAGGLELGLNLIPEVFVYDRRMRAGERLVFVTDQATVDGIDERGVDLSSAGRMMVFRPGDRMSVKARG